MHGSDDFHLGPCGPGVCLPGDYAPTPNPDAWSDDFMRAASIGIFEEEDLIKSLR